MRFLKKYQGPFSALEARHLLQRSGFGASPSRINQAVQAGLEETLRDIFREDSGDARYRRLLKMAPRLAVRGDLESLQSLWFLRALQSPHPLTEKLALFWHEHFATAFTKVDDAVMMQNQMEIFYRRGKGPFRELLGAVAKDPAMLIWLDGDKSSKTSPNENFAREVMELFSLGIGHYHEKDVKEAARAFTGWRLRDGRFHYLREEHDNGMKEIFGESRAYEGDDVLDRCAAHKDCPGFIAEKLARFFLHANPSKDDMRGFTICLEKHKLNIGAFLRDVFGSGIFFARRNRVGRILCPVEFIVGALRTLDARASGLALHKAARAMGQEIYNPPSVAGWPEHRAWISTTTVVARQQFVAALAAGKDGQLKVRSALPENTSPEQLSLALLGRRIENSASGTVLQRAAILLTRPEAQMG